MKFIKFNGDIVEYSRDIMVMNVFLKYLKPSKYYFIKLKSLTHLDKEKALLKQSVDYEVNYLDK
jgi:hypothetical protein